MVYEWSADLAAACGGSTVYVLAGSSHLSPGKMGQEDPFDGENDAFKDMGDLPDSYSTTEIANGPWHEYVITDTVQLGPVWDPEKDGQPSPDATGDDTPDDDEDGVQRGPQAWTNNAMVDIILDVQGDAGAPPADVGLWLDWDGDGTGPAAAILAGLLLLSAATILVLRHRRRAGNVG